MTDVLPVSTLSERIEHVKANIAKACHAAGRAVEDVTLIAVSKSHPASDVVEAIACGLTHFGENRPEAALPKIEAVRAALSEGQAAPDWHMIGHIQSRKTRLVVPGYALIHSVDRLKLASRLSALSVDEGVTTAILLEVNVSGEQSKAGWCVEAWKQSEMVRRTFWDDVRDLLALPGLSVHGLMTMAPIVPDPELTRPTFRSLRELRDALAEDFPGADWHHLSMGMTDDYPVAIAEGATFVRIGRAIFGPR